MENKKRSDFHEVVSNSNSLHKKQESYYSLNEYCELNSLPSLSENVEEESSTLKSEEIQKILEKSRIINSQVNLRLKSFLEVSKLSTANITNDTTNFSGPSQRKTGNTSIVIDSEHLNQIKAQQEYLINLFDQLSLLQTEVETTYEKIIEDKHDNVSAEATNPHCCLEGFNTKNTTACTCNIF